MSGYEKIDFDSELLKKIREETEKVLNRLLLIAVKTGKESELTLKVNINKEEKSDKKRFMDRTTFRLSDFRKN